MSAPDDLDRYVTALAGNLSATYRVDEAHFGGRHVVVAHRSDFRWRWGAVRLFTTVTLAGFEGDVDVATLDEYLEAAGRAARAAAGRAPLGLQVGVAVVPIAVLTAVTPPAREWAGRAHGHKFAQISYPVVAGVTPRLEVVQPERMRVGRLFTGFLRDVVREVLPPPGEGSSAHGR